MTVSPPSPCLEAVLSLGVSNPGGEWSASLNPHPCSSLRCMCDSDFTLNSSYCCALISLPFPAFLLQAWITPRLFCADSLNFCSDTVHKFACLISLSVQSDLLKPHPCSIPRGERIAFLPILHPSSNTPLLFNFIFLVVLL